MPNLNKLIASILSSLLTVGGALMFLFGLVFGFLIAISPLMIVGIFAIFGIVFYVFRDKIKLASIKTELRSIRRGEPPRPPDLPPPPETEKKKEEAKEEKKGKRIVIELE
jgi:hypothetical protein